MYNDKKEIMYMIQHIFERYAEFRKPLHPMHKDTLRRLALAYVRLKAGGEPVGSVKE